MVDVRAALATPVVAPRRRATRFWADPRFLLGMLLIVVSVAATVFVVSAADERVPMLTARHALVPGDTATLDDFIVTKVDVPGAEQAYLAPADVPATGVVITRTVGAGELVPTAALGAASSVDARTVVIEASGTLATTVVEGATVDVWSAAKRDGGSFGPPTVLVPGAIVASVDRDASVLVSGGGASVELLVPSTSVAGVLAAVSNGASVSIVANGR